MSQWFLIVASFGSLYMVAGKRTAEVTNLGEDAAAHRKSLSAYPASYLRQTELLAATVTLLAYCLWAFERAVPNGFPFYQLSIVPITFGLMRYQLLLERGHGGAPEEAVLGDRHLLHRRLRLGRPVRPRDLRPLTGSSDDTIRSCTELLTGWGRTAATASPRSSRPTTAEQAIDAVPGGRAPNGGCCPEAWPAPTATPRSTPAAPCST